MNGTDSRLCPVASFDISGDEPSGSATRVSWRAPSWKTEKETEYEGVK
jgi:hypothetical protein